MNYRDIKTDHQAQKAAKELDIALNEGLIDNRKVWVASGSGKSFWAGRKVYALRAWLNG